MLPNGKEHHFNIGFGEGEGFKSESSERVHTIPATDAAKQWNGWGTALKPAHEPIVLARKPLVGTVAENVLQHGTGGLNIDRCRIETNGETLSTEGLIKNKQNYTKLGWKNTSVGGLQPNEQFRLGRWPANVILSHSEGCTLIGTKKIKGIAGGKKPHAQQAPIGTFQEKELRPYFNHADAEGNETVEDWRCVENCPLTMFPETQNGGQNQSSHRETWLRQPTEPTKFAGDCGSAARFFYCAKASKEDREEGLDGTRIVKYNTGLCRAENTELVGLLARVTSESTARWLIGESGENIVGQCPWDSLSITLTTIRQITTSQILNLLTPSLINGFIRAANCETGNGGNHAESAESLSPSIPTTTSANPAASVRGVNHAVSKMLLAISDAANWKPLNNFHSTVKPTDLMRYLVRMVTPPDGTVLDPFCGSGSTGKAAVLERFNFVGIELNEEYCELAKRRIMAVTQQGTLFR